MKSDWRFTTVAFCALLLFIFSVHLSRFDQLIRPQPWKTIKDETADMLSPICDNLVENISRGRWVEMTELERYRDRLASIANNERRLKSELKAFWLEAGIQTATWRKDFRCGYHSYQDRPPHSTWPRVGSWCDPEGGRPCCSNNFTGTCMEPSSATCNCDGCVDLRKYKHAETSEWIVDDARCKWKSYTGAQVCDVIERSPFHDIHYVGDSFMRNMFRTMSIMITEDFEYGGMGNDTEDVTRDRCKNMQQYYRRECRATLNDIARVYRPKTLCGGRGYMNFIVESHTFYNLDYRSHFLDLVKSKLDVNGSLIIVGVGFHMACDSGSVINRYLSPAVDVITKRHGSPEPRVDSKRLSHRWPQIVFCLSPVTSLLKPPEHLSRQNPAKCDKYSNDILAYAKQHDILVLDFRIITKFIHSFDGMHHSLAVNKLKNTILLNYIASLDT